MAQKEVPNRRQEAYVPRVVVKFRDHLSLPYEDGVEKQLLALHVAPVERLLRGHPGVTFKRLFTSLGADEVRKLTSHGAERDRQFRPPDLLTYFAVPCPPGVEPEAVVKELLTWPAVEKAYIEGPPGPPPTVNAADDVRAVNQGYLDAAPDGIDAEFAWSAVDPGGAGEGIGFIDLEQGWNLSHEDLAASGVTLVSGLNQAYFFHGTGVLGEVVAVDNALGDVGIATHAKARVISEWRAAGMYNTADAIVAAAAAMDFGDVLLLETQYWGGTNPPWPTEVQDAVFDAIRLATALGIVVVEAAGNGGNDLDAYTDALQKHVLDRASPDFRDSGAIMVGAASSATPHTRMGFSNFGSRIDCYAWGENVDTLSTDGAGTANLYTNAFNGTSSASPIIAGAALIIQSVMKQTAGYRMSPLQVRDILADPLNGTASSSAADRIGVMPNLQWILQTVLGVTPDLYLRDHVGDDGQPHAGAISASPDIILRSAQEANPQAAFGEGSGTENDDLLGHEAVAGEDNYVYVRVRNRGGQAAANATVTVYWAPVSTLMTPDLWTLVGTATIANVPAGDVLAVSDAIVWHAADIPGSGHYCFVGLVGSALDPAPAPTAFGTWDAFQAFIRNNNNVTWRNFNVTSPAPTVGEFAALPFLVPGTPDMARRMSLQIAGRLPRGARLEIEVPIYWLEGLQRNSPFVKADAKRGVARIPLNPHGVNAFRELTLPRASRAAVRLLVHIPKEFRENTYRLHVRQMHGGNEVGRVTWILTDRRRKPSA